MRNLSPDQRSFAASLSPEIKSLIDNGAIFFCSTSGGKDSQLMTYLLKAILPPEQFVLVHADMGPMEWKGIQDHISQSATMAPDVVRSKYTLLEMVERRGKWPGPRQRYCTSDGKRTPIFAFIRRTMKERGATLAVDCQGIRAAESPARRAKIPFRLNDALSKAGRTVYSWFPIFDVPTNDVYDILGRNNQKLHPVYEHNKRCSCVICFFQDKADLRASADRRPDVLNAIEATEKRIGHTLFTRNGQPIPIRQHIYGNEKERSANV